MRVSIKTPYGISLFEMSDHNVTELLRVASRYQQEDRSVLSPAIAPASKPVHKSRNESMFGDRKTWNMPQAPTHEKPAMQKPAHEIAPRKSGVFGFIAGKCEKCGNIKPFFHKNPLESFKCSCGHETPLDDVIPAHVSCKCGRHVTYRTNIRTREFTIPCFGCGAPIDMELNSRGTAHVPVDSYVYR